MFFDFTSIASSFTTLAAPAVGGLKLFGAMGCMKTALGALSDPDKIGPKTAITLGLGGTMASSGFLSEVFSNSIDGGIEVAAAPAHVPAFKVNAPAPRGLN